MEKFLMTNSNHKSEMLADIVNAFSEYADRPALIIDDTTYSYAELYEKVVSILPLLEGTHDSSVGIVAENTLSTYAAILAVLLSGNTYVVLHPDFPDARNRAIITKAGIGVVLYERSVGPWWEPADSVWAVSMASSADGSRVGQGSDPVGTADSLTALVPVKSDAPAYIIFTSGSTGEPKGVPISRANLDAFYHAYRHLGWQLDCHDRMLQMFELTFDVSVVSFLYPLTLGACVCTVPSGGMKYLNVLDVMERQQLTFAAIAPSVLRLAQPYFPELSLPSLRYLVVTAEATDVSLIDRFRSCIPNAEVVNLYGPTEATIYCTSYVLPRSHPKHHNGMAAIGKPFSGMTARVVDQDGHDVPEGTMGELWMAGPQLMSGYWHDEVRTRQCFVTGADGWRYYRTGDLCMRDADGDLLYCGRQDTQVKIQGFRVELGEIEFRAKAFFHNARNCVVLARRDNDGNYALYLFVEGAAESDRQPLESYLQDSLPPYMVPRQICFLPVFPLNSNNKTDKRQLARLIEQ